MDDPHAVYTASIRRTYALGNLARTVGMNPVAITAAVRFPSRLLWGRIANLPGGRGVVIRELYRAARRMDEAEAELKRLGVGDDRLARLTDTAMQAVAEEWDKGKPGEYVIPL